MVSSFLFCVFCRAMGLPDLGLIAAPRNAAAELANEMHTTAAEHEVSRIQFKTKTISSFGPPGGEGQEAEFKKRKFGGDSKRQVRKREEWLPFVLGMIARFSKSIHFILVHTRRRSSYQYLLLLNSFLPLSVMAMHSVAIKFSTPVGSELNFGLAMQFEVFLTFFTKTNLF